VIRRIRPTEEGPKVPLWIITFTDMTTNLLTFFVLLLTMGQIRDDSLFDEGQRISLLFLESVKAGFGFRTSTEFQHQGIRYSVERPEQLEGIIRDAREEQTRRLFQTLRRSMQTLPSQWKGDRPAFSIAPVRFADGEVGLDEAGRQWLSRYCSNVRQNLDPATTTLYVVGVAGGDAADVQSWQLAARQAHAVAEFLRRTLSPTTARADEDAPGHGEPSWRIFWWGAGPGASWAGQDAPGSGQSQILIGAMKTSR
jgi:hypothetical protein